MSEIKLVCSDLDGTLLSSKHVISPLTVEAVHRLRQRGVKFIVSTGRPYPDVFAKLRDVGLEPDYVVTSNGGRAHTGEADAAARRLVAAHDMDPAVVLALLRLTNADIGHDAPAADPQWVFDNAADGFGDAPRDFTVHVNHEGEGLATRALPGVAAAFHPEYQYRRLSPAELAALTPQQLAGTHSLWVRGSHAVLEKVRAYLQDKFPGAVQSHFALPFILDCVGLGVSKGAALTELAQTLGVPLAETAAFGDGENDLSMLQVAGKAFLMGNAPPYVQRAAPAHAEVIGSNDDEGVAKKLLELFP